MKAQRLAMDVGLRRGLAVAGALALGGCGMFGAGTDPRDFTAVDTDGDATVTREEFTKWGRDGGLLNAYMEEGAKDITETALSQGLGELWNVEGSGITEAEWNEGMRAWFPEAVETQAFMNWDLDQDGLLDEQEMIAGLAHGGLLKGFDEDGNGQIAPNELLSRFYQVFDADEDERLNMDEWSGGLGRWNWPI